MTELSEQIRAWADAASAATVSPPVSIDDIVDGRPGRQNGRPVGSGRGRRLALVGVVAVFVGALTAAAVVATTRSERDSVRTEATTPGARPVVYRELGGGVSTSVELGALHAASTSSELSGLWAALGLDDEPVPVVDFDREVVVAMTVMDHTCALTFEGFDRADDTVTARFDQPSSGCERAPLPSTFVYALDRATTGPEFRLVLPAQPQAELGETFLDVGGVVPGVAGPTATFHLSADTMAAGSTIAGTVQVYNNADEAIEASTCGPYFVAVLEGEAATQLYSRPRCLEPFLVPPGISSYPVTAKATFLTCINGQASELVPACLPDGSMPTLPPGTYEARVVTSDGGIPVEASISVTVT